MGRGPQHPVVDLLSNNVTCTLCGALPTVAYTAARRHFFWGCSNFATTGCKGPKEWQKMSVPQQRRDDFLDAEKVDHEAAAATGTKRPCSEAENSNEQLSKHAKLVSAVEHPSGTSE
jgi:hypothetical protein